MADDPNIDVGMPQAIQQAPAGLPPQLMQAAQQQTQQQGALQAPNLRPEMPNIVRLISQMIKPTANTQPGESASQLQRPSRLDAFENFLGTFLTSFSEGMKQGGTGPGANARGFGAAMLAPQQQQVNQFQLNQQAATAQNQQRQAQAELQKTQAETESLKPTIPMVGPDGNIVMVPPAHVGTALAAQYRFSGGIKQTDMKDATALKVQGMKGEQSAANMVATLNSREKIAANHDVTTLAAAQIRANAASQQLRVIVGPDGNPTYVPRNQAAGMTPATALGANERVKLQTNTAALNNAIPRVQNVLNNADVISSMIDSGRIAMSIGADGTLQAVAGRGVTLTPKEAKFASDFQTMSEDINLLRGPMGATGFRSQEAFQALQAQRGRLSQNPQVFKGVIGNTLAAMMSLKKVNDDALAVKGGEAGGSAPRQVIDLTKP